jgi:plasmid stability protein
MSLEDVRSRAAQHTHDYVEVPAAVLAKALEESGELPKPGSLAEHVGRRLKLDPQAVMHVHRDAHLGKLLGVAQPAVESGDRA